MLSRALRLLVLGAAASLANAGVGPAWAQDDELEAMATALKDTTFTLQDALKVGEREGQPISAQFEIDDGKLQISIYTTKGDDFSEVVADPKTGAVVKTEKITDTDELNDAADQKAAIAKAKNSLVAAADAAVKENSGFRAVSIFPDLRDGHAIAEVTLLQGTTAKKVTEKLD
ncbi:MAG TPA: PepSY domain-containing protein [Stellaceae bacterium]|nr:PepSY domain-containing protein [Stellaceae bacterium]